MHFARKMRIGWISSNAKSLLVDPSQQRAAAPWWGVTLSPTFGDAGGFGIPEETLEDLRSQEFEALQKYSSLNVCHMRGNRNMGERGRNETYAVGLGWFRGPRGKTHPFPSLFQRERMLPAPNWAALGNTSCPGRGKIWEQQYFSAASTIKLIEPFPALRIPPLPRWESSFETAH